MHTTQSSFCPRLARVFFFVAVACANLAAAAADLDFDKTFDIPGEPRQVHYAVRYTLNGQTHASETWRDRDSRILRRTDGRIETHVDRNGRDVEWHMVVLDLPRKIRTDIDRTNLLRIGQFTDWFSLSHGLSRPAGAYTLTAADAAPSAAKPVAPCRWYDLKRGGSDSRICWSRQLHLPMLITDGSGNVQWQVTQVDTRKLPASVFAIRDQGFVRNNANEDIRTD
jgi:hypothetical protein